MHKGWTKGWWLLSVALLLAPSLMAQEDDFAEDTAAPAIGIRRKLPGILHRPDMPTPSEQLAYADGLRQRGKARAAAKQYEALVRTWHQAPEAAQAQMKLAGLHAQKGRYRRAFDEYQYLIDYFAENFEYEKVLAEQFRLANAVRSDRHVRFFGLFKGFAAPERALPLYQKIVENAPNWERSPECQFQVGTLHEESGDYDLAASAYEVVQTRYPAHALAPDAAYRKAHCLVVLADKSPRDVERSKAAIAALSGYLIAYPSGSYAQEAEEALNRVKDRLAAMFYEQAVFYDRIAAKPKAAVIAYTDFLNKFPSSTYRETVEARLAELKKDMTDDEKQE